MVSVKRPRTSDQLSNDKPFAKPHTDRDARPAKRRKSFEDQNQKPTGKISYRTSIEKPRKQLTNLLREEEPAFPRGGASLLTPLEHKQIQIEATRDVLFEQNATKKSKVGFDDADDDDVEAATTPVQKKRKSRSKRKLDKIEASAEDSTVKIEGLSYKRLVPGSVVLGQISQINAYDIALTLPNNLTGFVPITSISDALSSRVDSLLANGKIDGDDEDSDEEEEVNLRKFFTIGQYLRARVISTMNDAVDGGIGKGKRHIELSLKPFHANSGLKPEDLVPNIMLQSSVLSVEDHGLIMDLGLEDSTIKGFLSSKDVGQGMNHSRIETGAVLLCIITGQNQSGKIIKLSADMEKAGNLKKTHFLTDAPTVDPFLPGTAVQFAVTDISSKGLVGKLMGMIDVTADLFHSGSLGGQALDQKFSIGDKVKGRIICTFPTVEPKKLGISLLGHIQGLCQFRGTASPSIGSLLPVSTIIEEAKVTRVEPGLGLFVNLGAKQPLGFVHISRITDGKLEELAETGSFEAGSTHRTRIVGYNDMDGLFLASMEPHVIDQQFLRIDDVPVGHVVKGHVEKLIINDQGIGGVLVKIADGITGLVPEMHLADVRLQHPEKRFKEGMRVTARVLSSDPSKRQLRLTLKKTLVNSDASVLKTYDDIKVGAQSPGTLINILPNGAVIQFYGGVRGFLPLSEMSETFIKDPTEHFRTGQVVNVRVISIDSTEGRMLLSCRDPTLFNKDQLEALEHLEIGQIVQGSVIDKSSKDLVLELNDTALKAVLPFGHLTDDSDRKNLSALKKIHVGDQLSALVLDKQKKTRVITLTKKPSLIQAAEEGKLIKSFEDVSKGIKTVGTVKNITDSGVFVQFAGGVTGLFPRSNISEDLLQRPEYGFQKFQSLSCNVASVDYQKRQFILSIGESSIPADKHSSGTAEPSLINPVDGNSISIEDFVLGKQTRAKIISIKETQINVQLADGVLGRVDMSEVFDDWDAIKDRKRPLKAFKNKQIIPVRIMGVHDARNHRFLPITHRTGRVPVFELTAMPKKQQTPKVEMLSLDSVALGSKWVAYVNNIAQDCAWVNLSPNVRGRIKIVELSDDISLLKDVEKNFPVGSALRVSVIGKDVASNRLDLSARSQSGSGQITFNSLVKGMVLPGKVTKVSERQVMVQITDLISGPITLTNLSDDYGRANPTIHKKNDIVRVCITDLDVPNKRLTLSTRPSRVLNSSLPVTDPEIHSAAQLKVNDVLRGFVKNVADNGLFIYLSPTVTAYVRVSDLSDSFIKDWKSLYQVDQLVKGKVIGVDASINHVQMSLKASVLDPNYVPPLTFNDLQVGQVVTGKIRMVEDFGVFIVVDDSANVSGLCHKSVMADQKVDNVRELYDVGDLVMAKVLKIIPEKRRVNFGLKASYFQDIEKSQSDDVDASDSEGLNGMDGLGLAVLDSDQEMDNVEDEDGGVDLDNIRGISSDDQESTVSEVGETPRATGNVSIGLSTSGFDWTAGLLDQGQKQDASDTEASDTEIQPKRKKRRKSEIQIDRTGDLDANGPRSQSDFERLLLGQPDSSFLWVSYMALQLQLGEVEKAREVAERALQSIGIREDAEKMNVWVALLNLENTYGEDSAVEEVFKRACQYCDAQEIHERLISIYIQSGKQGVSLSNPRAVNHLTH